ncbi:MAG: DUF1016 domain-containing protein [Bacteroidia bacterium]|nr:DUF1016 domain-containing protein [Bacteroidia bacterium]
MTTDKAYTQLLETLRGRIRQARLKATLLVNAQYVQKFAEAYPDFEIVRAVHAQLTRVTPQFVQTLSAQIRNKKFYLAFPKLNARCSLFHC